MKRRFSFFRFAAGITVSAALLCLAVVALWWNGRAYARVSLRKTYYFLVRESEQSTTASVTAQVYLAGGAGYALSYEGKECVALACYYRETEAESVRSSLAQKGVNAVVVTAKSRDFELGGRAATLVNDVVSSVNAVDSVARVLYEIANGLERCTLAQEGARSALRDATDSLGGLVKNGGTFSLWDSALTQAVRSGREIASGIVFAKDVRYLQIRLIAAILNAEQLFT